MNESGKLSEAKTEDGIDLSEFHSDVHIMWPTHMEVVALTTDIGGWEAPAFHERLADAAGRMWDTFQHEVLPNLPEEDPVKMLVSTGSMSEAFAQWQVGGGGAGGIRDLREYRKLSLIVKRLAERYWARSGAAQAASMNYTKSSLVSVFRQGDTHSPKSNPDATFAAVFFAKAAAGGGQIRFTDPRGASPPFGRHWSHQPAAGELFLFPNWLRHIVSAAAAPHVDESKPTGYASGDPLQVTLSFTLGPSASYNWNPDPAGYMQISSRT